MSAERPGPNAGYWLASGPSTLPPNALMDWLHMGLSNGLIDPATMRSLFPQQQQPQTPTFPVIPQGGDQSFNALSPMRQAQGQPYQQRNALFQGRR